MRCLLLPLLVVSILLGPCASADLVLDRYSETPTTSGFSVNQALGPTGEIYAVGGKTIYAPDHTFSEAYSIRFSLDHGQTWAIRTLTDLSSSALTSVGTITVAPGSGAVLVSSTETENGMPVARVMRFDRQLGQARLLDDYAGEAGKGAVVFSLSLAPDATTVVLGGSETTGAGGATGFIRVSTDAGTTWKTVALGSAFADQPVSLQATARDATEWFASASLPVSSAALQPIVQAAIYATTDGGQHWSRELLARAQRGSASVTRILALPDGRSFACGAMAQHWLTRPEPAFYVRDPITHRWASHVFSELSFITHISCNGLTAKNDRLLLGFSGNTGFGNRPILLETSVSAPSRWHPVKIGPNDISAPVGGVNSVGIDDLNRIILDSSTYDFSPDHKISYSRWLTEVVDPCQGTECETPQPVYPDIPDPSWPLESLPPTPPSPKANPTTAAKVELGKLLFFDARLSKDSTVSCNSCHSLTHYGVDGHSVSTGVGGQLGTRNAPTVLNSGYISAPFWDGREPNLEGQAKQPILNPAEMAMPDAASVEARVRGIAGYRRSFVRAFGSEGEPVTFENVAKAISAFERTLNTGPSPYDRFIAGQTSAISVAAKRGMTAIRQVGCLSCHSGPNFDGGRLPDEGVPYFRIFPVVMEIDPENADVKKYRLDQDAGMKFGVGPISDVAAVWRIPSWRNVEKTAPYFHNGSVPTLEEAVRLMGELQLEVTLTDQQVADITEFLKSLTGTWTAPTKPQLPN